MDDTAIVVQARIGSSRMPGKMLEPFSGKQSLLEVILGRVKKDCKDIPLIVATTDTSKDDRIAELLQQMNIACFRGSENNVLHRFINAAQQYKIQKIIRLCADNPFIDTESIRLLADRLNSDEKADYIAFSTQKGLPTIKTHYGFWAEGTTLRTLQKIERLTTEQLYLEHVTNFIYANPDLFDIKLIPIDKSIDDNKKIRLTIDTPNDFQNIRTIYSEIIRKGIKMSPQNITQYLDSNPGYYDIMEQEIANNTK